MRARDYRVAESMFNRQQSRESELDEVLNQERGRDDAVMKNMTRLRALRIERDAKNQTVGKLLKSA
jgi:hypothetical protein